MTVRSEFPVELHCPMDHSALARKSATWLSCSQGHKYPVVEDIPVLLRDDVAADHLPRAHVLGAR
jgi:uncharacterized protein YbaR (Trm112 family)